MTTGTNSSKPSTIMELGLKAGIEWMTIEDFVTSLKKSDSTPASYGS